MIVGRIYGGDLFLALNETMSWSMDNDIPCLSFFIQHIK